MKSDRWLYGCMGGSVVASLLVVLLSWIGSVCGWAVENLLTPESVRWFLKTAFARMGQSLCLELMVVLMGAGVILASGWLSAVKKIGRRGEGGKLFRKKRQALVLSVLLACGYAALLAWTVYSRHAMLLGVTGTFDRSPFQSGWAFLLALGLTLMGTVYGLAAGQFRSFMDVFRGFSVLLSRMAGYFVYLFLVVQCFALFQQARFDKCFAWDDSVWPFVAGCFYYLPFVCLLYHCLAHEDHRL